MTRRERLLDVPRTAPARPRSRCKDLVPVDPNRCPDCGNVVVALSVGQPALFSHGGYGATRMSVVRQCADPGCARARSVDEVTTRPDRRR